MVQRQLTKIGLAEIGHIFTDGYVPLVNDVPITTTLGLIGQQRVFLVDWKSLTPEQQAQVIEKMASRFGEAERENIRAEIEANGHYPITADHIIEAYDMRLII